MKKKKKMFSLQNIRNLTLYLFITQQVIDIIIYTLILYIAHRYYSDILFEFLYLV